MDDRKVVLMMAKVKALNEADDFAKRTFKILLENGITWHRGGISYVPSVREIRDEVKDLIVSLDDEVDNFVIRVESENIVVELTTTYGKVGEFVGYSIDMSLIIFQSTAVGKVDDIKNDQTC